MKNPRRIKFTRSIGLPKGVKVLEHFADQARPVNPDHIYTSDGAVELWLGWTGRGLYTPHALAIGPFFFYVPGQGWENTQPNDQPVEWAVLMDVWKALVGDTSYPLVAVLQRLYSKWMLTTPPLLSQEAHEAFLVAADYLLEHGYRP